MPLFLSRDELKEILLSRTPLIDVRAPVEFEAGHLPGAINAPLLENEERALVGTAYKNQGSEAAIQLGHRLVSGDVKEERMTKWLEFLIQNPNAVIYCFRGGLRSQIVQSWLSERHVLRPLIAGGFKAARNFLLEELQRISRQSSLLILSGRTGSGKTSFLKTVQKFYPVLDLEALARHRGSAFGAMGEAQPSQVSFENSLATELMRYQVSDQRHRPLLVEDESHLIGRRAVPQVFFEKMRASPVIWIEESLDRRIENIFQDYIVSVLQRGSMQHSQNSVEVFDNFKKSIRSISRKLGGLRTQELLTLIQKAQDDFDASQDLSLNRQWIEKLLVYYYDPMYSGSLARREVSYEFKGAASDCAEYLRQ